MEGTGSEALVNPALKFYVEPRPREEVVSALGLAGKTVWSPRKLGEWRDEAIRRYGFSIPCLEAVEAIARGSPLLEVGAGTGYWAKLLEDAGANIVSTDADSDKLAALKFGVSILRLDAAKAVQAFPERNVFVSWPSSQMTWAMEMAEAMVSGRTLFYIGEWEGCTGDDGFREFLETGFELVDLMAIPTWPGTHDWLHTMRRKA